MNNLNNIVVENKKKIKKNQGKLNNLINLIKTKEIDLNRRNKEDCENIEIKNEIMSDKVFRYVKKLPQKHNETSSKIKKEKNENIKNLKQLKKQNSNDNNNFIINGLNQIYKKSFTIREEKYNNFILNKEDNKKKKYNKNNIYPNRLFPDSTSLKNSESSNNMRCKIPLKDTKSNKNKKENIYVNKIQTNRNFLNKYQNSNNKQNIDNTANNSFKYDKNTNINNLNILNNDYKDNNKNPINIKNNKVFKRENKTKSPKNIYIPKKATSFRGISQENYHLTKRKNMSPIYYKKLDSENNKFNKFIYNNSEKERLSYFYNSEKRDINRKFNNYEDINYINNKGRATYSRKHSAKKQNYCWQNNNSYDNKLESQNEDNYQEIKILNKGNGDGKFFDINQIFENDIDEISSIKNNSSYDSYTLDYESNLNRFKFPNADNDYNYKSKNEKKNNLIYIHKLNNNINNYNENNDNNIKIVNYVTKNQNNINNINRETDFKNNKNKSDKRESIETKSYNNKQNLRYINSDKKFSDKYIGHIDQNRKNPNCYSYTTFSFFKKQNNNENKYTLNKNNINYKSQKNYFNNLNNQKKKEEKNIIRNNKKNSNILHKILKNQILSFGLDDLAVLDEKFRDILDSLDSNKPAYNNCFDFLNYFKNNCDILHNLKLLIKNKDDFIIIKNGINYILITIIMLFDYSYKQNALSQIILFIKEMINLNYKNLILIYEYLLEYTLLSEIKNVWELKLIQIIYLSKSDQENNTSFDNLISNFEINNNNKNENILLKIKNNISFIFQTIKIIIKNYKNKNSNILFYFFKEIHKKSSLKDIFYFFKNKILHSNGLFGYLSPQLALKQSYNLINKISAPYIKTISKKKYTLILGLEETLINFKFVPTNNKGISGLLKFRPGVNSFLSEMKKYFELIVFSLYPQKIGEYLINTLEKKEKFFDYRFYVQHATVNENEFVKDLRKIGRPLDRMIIVDNLPQNYKLNKKNGINIKSYWEEDYNDEALKELSIILIKIFQDAGDLRNGIEKYRNEILGRVSSKIDL